MSFKKSSEGGFTITEVLVAIAIVLILAAVVIPQFLNQRDAVMESDVEAYLVNSATTLETERNAAAGYYPSDAPDSIKSRVASGDIEINYYIPTDEFSNKDRRRYCLDAITYDGMFQKYVTSASPNVEEGECPSEWKSDGESN